MHPSRDFPTDLDEPDPFNSPVTSIGCFPCIDLFTTNNFNPNRKMSDITTPSPTLGAGPLNPPAAAATTAKKAPKGTIAIEDAVLNPSGIS